MATSIPTSDLDLYSDEVLAEPYEQYRRLREAGPAVWLERHNAWVVTRYDSVRAVLRDWKTFSSASGVALNDTLNTAIQGNTLGSDPPLHDSPAQRGCLSHDFTSSAPHESDDREPS